MMNLGSVRIAVAIGVLAVVAPARGQFCESLLGPMQQGLSDREIARLADLPVSTVRNCRRDLQQPIRLGPDGFPPINAPGGPPVGAAGQAPRNPAGPPPVGAPGGPAVGRQMQRVP
jgi:hypothetical protein